MDLGVALSTRRNESLLELTGVLDYASVPYLRQVVFERLDAGSRRIALEGSGLRLLDAAAIKVMTYLQRRAGQLDGDVRLTGTAGTVLSAVEVAGVAKQLGAYDKLDWPVTQRQRHPVALQELRVGHGHWPPDVTELLTRMHRLDPDDPRRRHLRDEVIEACLPTARRLARRYGGAGEPLADLVQVAALGLVKAVDGFDPARGIEFGAYATPTIAGEIKRHFRDRTWGVRLPRRLQELRLQVGHARDELTQRLGRSPTVAELAAHLSTGEEDVIEVLGSGDAYRPVSLDTPTHTAEESTTIADTIGGEPSEYNMVEFREALRVLVERLPEREQRILAMRFYGNLTQTEIAERVGLSQMHVSRLLAHALGFLRRRLSE
ncbi:SigB/SigF/SigG family RNA polymerase sigma factor [Dactylosporangium sp. NPDC000555]|uniref:SigB/SigF/SigG family RNA polymerase sigma factor n=1 Tax=Dactylosporangium sp. NPDC000555 TaxID=3154260 RepID=UPI0033250C39